MGNAMLRTGSGRIAALGPALRRARAVASRGRGPVGRIGRMAGRPGSGGKARSVLRRRGGPALRRARRGGWPQRWGGACVGLGAGLAVGTVGRVLWRGRRSTQAANISLRSTQIRHTAQWTEPLGQPGQPGQPGENGANGRRGQDTGQPIVSDLERPRFH